MSYEKEIEEIVAGKEEEESPSLDLEEKDEGLKAEEVSEVEEAVVSEKGEEWPSINAIPGFEPSEPKQYPLRAQSKSQSRPTNDDVSGSSSLGELRFQDE